jgi:hypothetical protein
VRGYANPAVVQQAIRLLALRDTEQIEEDELVQSLGRLFWAAFDVDALRNRIAELEGRAA